MLMYTGRMCWVSSKLITQIISLGSSLPEARHRQSSGIGVGSLFSAENLQYRCETLRMPLVGISAKGLVLSLLLEYHLSIVDVFMSLRCSDNTRWLFRQRGFLVLSTDFDESWRHEIGREHRRRSSVNFGGKTFFTKAYAWKINKTHEFYMIFARKIVFARIWGATAPLPFVSYIRLWTGRTLTSSMFRLFNSISQVRQQTTWRTHSGLWAYAI